MIKVAQSEDEREQLDELLWRVLWQPLELPRSIRKTFALSGEEIELVAVIGNTVIGGLAAFRSSEAEVEIRHLAVDENRQRNSVGSSLILKLFEMIKQDQHVRVRACVRNTSLGFFEKNGFAPVDDEWMEHPDFIRHGIKFRLIEKHFQ